MQWLGSFFIQDHAKSYRIFNLSQVVLSGVVAPRGERFDADWSILCRLVTACKTRSGVNMQAILQHVLMPVPLFLAETNHTIRTQETTPF